MAMKLLLIGDERKTRRMFAWGFAAEGYSIKMAGSRAAAEALIEVEAFHAGCVDWKMQDEDPAGITRMIRDRLPQLPLVALVGENERRLGPSLKAQGIAAYLVSPFAIENLHASLRTHALPEPVKFSRVTAALPRKKEAAGALSRLMVMDDKAGRMLELALRAAKSDAAILILGETGTGKSLLAQAIHENSTLREHPFVTVNCPCLNRELLESELFGHARGAFTGAVQDTPGKVAVADGGTLFLDEIGDLPTGLQPKLLRLLQEKQYERVGEATSRSANVRIIAATNRDLKRDVDAGRFREDLFYRLNVIAIDVPPLRGRPAQIMGAAKAFLESLAVSLGKPDAMFSPEAQALLENHAWPGNLRELRNVVERAAILSSGSILGPDDFPALCTQGSATLYQIGGAVSLHAVESAHIQLVVANSASLEEAARILQIDKSTLYRKRKQMESRIEEFTPPGESKSGAAVATGG
ncbi:MAG: sigma-54-dependent transcriptional regulator [Opitutaceae bacterium]